MDEEELIIYNKGIKEGQKHTEPSFKTSHFMEKTNLTMELMKKDLKIIAEKIILNTEEHKEINLNNRRMMEKIEGWMDKMEDKYTQKSQFEFWRNIMVSGIFLSIFLGIITLLTEKMFG